MTTCCYTVSLLLLVTKFLLRSKLFALSIFNYEGIGASSILLLLMVALLLMVLDMNLISQRIYFFSAKLMKNS